MGPLQVFPFDQLQQVRHLTSAVDELSGHPTDATIEPDFVSKLPLACRQEEATSPADLAEVIPAAMDCYQINRVNPTTVLLIWDGDNVAPLS